MRNSTRTRLARAKGHRLQCAPVTGYRAALSAARGFLGPRAAVRYDTKRPRDQRCLVCVEFESEGHSLHGVVGWGPEWSDALIDARKRFDDFKAKAGLGVESP